MSVNWKNIWVKAKNPLLYTGLGALLVLNIKNCSDGNKSRETNEFVKQIANDMDTTKQDVKTLTVNTDTIKAFSKATNKVAQRIEEKTEIIEETTDSILAKLDSCCDCNKKTVKKPVVRQEAKKKAGTKKTQSQTSRVIVYDTIKVVEKPQEKPRSTEQEKKQDCKISVRCMTPEEWAIYCNNNKMYE